ncbi:MAG: hypothetical protein QOJ92_2036 [Frankiales bacterium]|nr:hypothetical protein [Frankiales bacterium]
MSLGSRISGQPRRVVAVGALVAVSLIAGLSDLAYAFWITSGSGSGSAATGSPVVMTVNVTNITGVYPGQKTTVPLSVTNTNQYPVTVSNITLDSVTPTGTGCLAADIALDSSASGVSGSTYTVTGSLTKSGGATPSANYNVPISVANLADACQGAGHSFSLTFTVHGQSA